MAASGGWSETAGPWVKPEEGMKKVVWSETRVEGPRKFERALGRGRPAKQLLMSPCAAAISCLRQAEA